jgi:hypothetical protein
LKTLEVDVQTSEVVPETLGSIVDKESYTRTDIVKEKLLARLEGRSVRALHETRVRLMPKYLSYTLHLQFGGIKAEYLYEVGCDLVSASTAVRLRAD